MRKKDVKITDKESGKYHVHGLQNFKQFESTQSFNQISWNFYNKVSQILLSFTKFQKARKLAINFRWNLSFIEISKASKSKFQYDKIAMKFHVWNFKNFLSKTPGVGVNFKIDRVHLKWNSIILDSDEEKTLNLAMV